MRDEQRGEYDQTSVAGIDEWDQDFLNEVIQIELEAISSRNFPSNNNLEQVPLASSTNPNPTFHHFPFNGFGTGGADGILGFSPPRELSQRPPEKPEPSQVLDVYEIKDPWCLRNDGPGVRGVGGAKKEKEVERLKRELGRVSKQLNHLEHECMELKKERAKKDEQLKCAFSDIEAKDAEINNLIRETSKQVHSRSACQLQNTDTYPFQSGHCPVSEDKCLWSNPHVLERITKGSNEKSKQASEHSRELSLDYQCHGPKRKDVQSDGIYAVSELKRLKMSDNNLTTSGGGSVLENTFHEISAQLKSTKTIGIQTDLVQANSLSALKDMLTVEHNLSSKLLAIWGSPICGSTYYKKTGRDLVSKLFVTCSVDFCVLFSCMSLASKTSLVSKKDESFSDMALLDHTPSVKSIDAAKVSQLYVILMKMHNEMAQLPALLQALLDLCTLENVSIAHRSLRILHAILQHFSSCDIRSDGRNNVLVDQSLNNSHENKGSFGLQNWIVDIHDKAHNGTEASGLFSPNIRTSDLENLCKDEKGSSSNSSPFSAENLVSVFETIRQIALRKSEEYIQNEVISIFNLILMRSNPNLEREQFGLMPLLEIVSHLLREEVGLYVRLQAVRLLFLLLNCPKMLLMFCSGGKDGTDELTEITDVQKDASALQKEITCIIQCLSGCLACLGAGAQGLKLRRQVIILLAYIAASGKSGFEILLNTATPHGLSFLESIIRVLASEMDADFSEAQVLRKERSSLMREALILLNRLVSHPAHSKATLGALMRSNAAASLTVDVANRISQKGRGACWKLGGGSSSSGGTKKTQMEAEIIDLARLFRTRVFAFLGENSS